MEDIIEVENGFLVKVPDDIKKPIVSTWRNSDDEFTTLEFYSNSYEMEYDTFEFGVEEQRKEIPLPKVSEYKIFRKIAKKYASLIDNNKWFMLSKIK